MIVNRTFMAFAAAMAFIVVASNVLVQHPFMPWGLQDYLTWGAFTYPVAFLVTDLSNRRFGPDCAACCAGRFRDCRRAFDHLSPRRALRWRPGRPS
jgi:uncharacterized PurR-regulated membrane protein YhhQ (DUF165 family)